MGTRERMERERQLEDQQVVEVAYRCSAVVGGMVVPRYLLALEVNHNLSDYLRIQAIQDM